MVKDQLLQDELKSHLKKFERLVRIFEMTYLDLTEKLKDNVKDKNLQVKPLTVTRDIELNTKGQMIYQNDQLFDKNAYLIDKQSKIK